MEPRQLTEAQKHQFTHAKKVLAELKETPLLHSEFFSRQLGPGATVLLKLENQQHTGSFKFRGAFYRLLTLTEPEREAGVITASAGNHGRGIARASKLLGIKSLVVVPETAPIEKTGAITSDGSTLIIFGKDFDESEARAKEISQITGLTYISGYNDPGVIAGQSTVGFEILGHCRPDVMLVPVGGGGLLSGIAMAAFMEQPRVQVFGVQSEASPVMYQSLKAGRIVQIPVKGSISDGLHGGIEANSITFDLTRRYSKGVLLVSEQETRQAIRALFEQHNQVAEGAGAVALAAALRYRGQFAKMKVVVVVSGGNISSVLCKDILCQAE